MRLHAALLALVVGRPCVLVEYVGTKARIMDELGLRDWRTSMDELATPGGRARVEELLNAFARQDPVIRQRVAAARTRALALLHRDCALAAAAERLCGEAHR